MGRSLLKLLYFTLILFPLVLNPSATFAQLRFKSDAYEKGLALKKEGRYEDALKTWWQARTELEMRSKSDPRLGIAFIELATAQQLTQYYGTASEMYLWGFSRADMNDFKKAIEAEVKRILPLLDDEIQKAWKKLVKQRSNEIFQKIRQFWIEKDPTPAVLGNERLIEHWQRIAYARKHFTKNRLSVYGSDDRGLIYVKYGEPDKSIQRIIGSRLNEAVQRSELYGKKQGLHESLKDAIGFGECEIWAYGSINDDDRVLFIFGNREGTGAFRLFEGVEDLIRPDLFRTGGKRELILGPLIQLLYYNELYTFDSSFSKRYHELDSQFNAAYSNFVRNNTTRYLARAFNSSFQGMHKKYQISDKYDPLRKYADKDRSELDDLGKKIRLNTSMTRILNKQNEPKLVFIAFAIPGIATGQENSAYNLCYTLLVRDSSFAELARRSTNLAPKSANTTFFTISHKSNQFHYTLTAEALSDSKSQQVLGAGKSFFEASEPLDPDPKELEISDLVIGIQPPDKVNANALPFPLLPTKQIWKTDAITVYIEVYHLAKDTDGQSRFNLDFKVIRLEKKGDGFERKEVIASAFDYHSPTRTAKEYFGIDISNLKKGDYELVVEIMDMISKRRKRRVERFEIYE